MQSEISQFIKNAEQVLASVGAVKMFDEAHKRDPDADRTWPETKLRLIKSQSLAWQFVDSHWEAIARFMEARGEDSSNLIAFKNRTVGALASMNAKHASELWPALRVQLERIALRLDTTSPKPRIKRRAIKPRKPKPLTPRQTEVVQIVGECKGNIVQAAKQLGRNRKTIEECYKTAMGKLGKEVVKHKKVTLYRDRRGQETVSENDSLQ